MYLILWWKYKNTIILELNWNEENVNTTATSLSKSSDVAWVFTHEFTCQKFHQAGVGSGAVHGLWPKRDWKRTRQTVKPRALFPQLSTTRSCHQDFSPAIPLVYLKAYFSAKRKLKVYVFWVIFTPLPESIRRVSYADVITKFSAIDRFPAFSFRYGAPLHANNRNV